MNYRNINELIDIINDEFGEKSGNSSTESKIYRDEPIIRLASQMKNYLPDKYAEMKRLIFTERLFTEPYEKIFAVQADFMYDFEDTFDYHGKFSRYYPTYRDMSDYDLRGYFSFRTEVRKGNIKKTEKSFVYLYLYELINLSGGMDPQKAYELMKAFTDVYRNIDDLLSGVFDSWLFDFVYYYGLEPSLLSDLPIYRRIQAAETLWNCDRVPPALLFDSLTVFSDYEITDSGFYKEYTKDIQAVTVKVYKDMFRYFDKNRKLSYPEKLIGKNKKTPHLLFNGAVFYEKNEYKKSEYNIGSHFKIIRDGRYLYLETPSEYKYPSHHIGILLRTVDRMMREKYDFPQKLSESTEEPKMLLKLIDKAVCEYLEYKKKAEKKKIDIDISKLGNIRKNADITRDKLITDEEKEELAEDINGKASDIPEDTKSTDNPPDISPLNKTEYIFMQKLLYSGDYTQLLKQNNLMLSVICDSINEKLFDIFGDTVIVFDSDAPELIDDYTEDLKGIIKNENT